MKPVIVGVDHNEATLEVLRLDMVKHYGADYDVLVVCSGREASELFGTLAAEARPVALVIAYQWMDGATGIEVFKRSRKNKPKTLQYHGMLTSRSTTVSAT